MKLIKSAEEWWVESLDPKLLQARRERTALAFGGILLFAVVGVLAYFIGKPGASDFGKADVLIAAQSAIRLQLQSRGQLRFTPPEQVQIVSLGANKFTVRGWVQDVSDSHPTLTYSYSVTLDRDRSRSMYTMTEVTIIPMA